MAEVLYIFTSILVLHTPNAGGNSHFQRFLCKKAEITQKSNNYENMKKLYFFLGEIMFLPLKARENLIKLGIKQSTSILVQT